MPFLPQHMSPDLQSSLDGFLQQQDFSKLYKSYSWERDTYSNGFPDILDLENNLRTAAMKNKITTQHIISVAKWGKLRNINRVKGPFALDINLYQENGFPFSQLEKDPLPPIVDLDNQVKGLGPTYLSKVIRFALPQEYGSIDTRIVRVVGLGDPDSKQRDWLELKTRNDGYGWYISKYQKAWPSEYTKWLDILRFFAQRLNDVDDPCPCPHPPNFVNQGLRTNGVWTCADVEMAVYSYISHLLMKTCGLID